MKNKILVIAAHPDDESLGVGGTIIKLSKRNDVYCLILNDGIGARYKNKQFLTQDIIKKRKGDVDKLKNILGLNEIYYDYLGSNCRFDSLELLDIVKVIEKHITKIKPNIIYTHNDSDLNIDHRKIHHATLIATRPFRCKSVKEIYSYEVLSSTEQNTESPFVPNTFVDISEYIENKISAVKCYGSEISTIPNPRSSEAIKALAIFRGVQSGIKYAEGFKLIRKVGSEDDEK